MDTNELRNMVAHMEYTLHNLERLAQSEGALADAISTFATLQKRFNLAVIAKLEELAPTPAPVVHFCMWNDGCDETVEQEGALCVIHQEAAKPQPGELGYPGTHTPEETCEYHDNTWQHKRCTKKVAFDLRGDGFCAKHFYEIAAIIFDV